MQVVEGGVGRERPHHIGAVAQQGVGEREELWGRFADRQHAIGTGVGVRRIELAAEFGEGLGAEVEFLLGDSRAHQGLQPHRRLGGVQWGRQGHVEAIGLEDRVGVADGDDGKPAGRAGGLQPPRQAQGLFADAAQVDDRGFNLQVGDRRHRREPASRRDRAPAKTVQSLGERARQGVVPRDDQNARLDAYRHLSSFTGGDLPRKHDSGRAKIDGHGRMRQREKR